MLAGVGGFARRALATDPPPAKEADVQKMKEALPDKAPAKPQKARKVLVYGNANGFVHSSINLGEQTIVALGEKTGAWTARTSNAPAAFDNLKDYDAVVLVSTTSHFLLPKGPEMRRPNNRNLSDEQRKAAEDEAKQKFDAAQKEYEATAKAAKEAEPKRLQNLVEFVKGGKGLA